MELTISADWVSSGGRRQSHLLQIGLYTGYVSCSGATSEPGRSWVLLYQQTRVASGHTRGHKAGQAAVEEAIRLHNSRDDQR